jgi:hypothetical protein
MTGAVYAGKEALDEAIADCTKAVSLKPEAYYKRALAYDEKRERRGFANWTALLQTGWKRS